VGSLLVLFVYGITAVFVSQLGNQASWRFLLALFPLMVILFGVAFLRQSGLTMAFAGLIITIILAVLEFGTSVYVALGSAAVGFVKSFPVSVSSVATMLMIFLMRETGALSTVSKVDKASDRG